MVRGRVAPASSNERGTELMMQGKYAEAEAAFRASIAVDPRYVPGHANLGAALLAQGRRDEAERVFQRALRLDRELAPAWFNLGVLHVRKKEHGEAERCLRRAIELMPEALEWRLALSWALLHAGNVRDGLASLSEAFRLTLPFHGEAALLASWYLKEIRGLLKGRKGEARFFDGLLELARGEFAGAERALRCVLEAQRDWPEAHFWLGKALVGGGDRASALVEFAAAVFLARRDKRTGEAFVAEARGYVGDALPRKVALARRAWRWR
jgi:tetratricopeptide (TPR) repeat protein